ncbi:hypothetical protein [Streptomyces sp. NPDC059076]
MTVQNATVIEHAYGGGAVIGSIRVEVDGGEEVLLLGVQAWPVEVTRWR